MNDVEPAESDVGEREIMREEEVDVSRDAGQQRTQRSPIGCTGHPARHLLAAGYAPLVATAAAALTTGHASFLFARCRPNH